MIIDDNYLLQNYKKLLKSNNNSITNNSISNNFSENSILKCKLNDDISYLLNLKDNNDIEYKLVIEKLIEYIKKENLFINFKSIKLNNELANIINYKKDSKIFISSFINRFQQVLDFYY